jgi:Fe-S cluster assembly iron-binding protein IscA
VWFIVNPDGNLWFTVNPDGLGFQVNNPNVVAACGCGRHPFQAEPV